MDLSIKSVIEDLDNGFTKFTKDDQGFGSIQARLNLTDKQVIILFNHPLLKGAKETPFPFKLIDDRDEVLNVSGEDVLVEPGSPVVFQQIVKRRSDEIVFVEAPSAAKELKVAAVQEEVNNPVSLAERPKATEVASVVAAETKSHDFPVATPVLPKVSANDEPVQDVMSML